MLKVVTLLACLQDFIRYLLHFFKTIDNITLRTLDLLSFDFMSVFSY